MYLGTNIQGTKSESKFDFVRLRLGAMLQTSRSLLTGTKHVLYGGYEEQVT